MERINPHKFASFRQHNHLTQDQLGELLGITGKYVGMIERGAKDVLPDSSLGLLFAFLEEKGPISAPRHAFTPEPMDSPARTAQPVNMIPVVGWAHAGEPVNYDELPEDWNDRVPSTSRDPKAFAVRLEGESMEPKFSEGDLLIVQPSFEAYNGCLAVCRFHDDGVIFRRVEFLPDHIQLIALNPAYPTTQHARESFAWIYPVFGSWKQIWK